jgi:hypothetical protein
MILTISFIWKVRVIDLYRDYSDRVLEVKLSLEGLSPDRRPYPIAWILLNVEWEVS